MGGCKSVPNQICGSIRFSDLLGIKGAAESTPQQTWMTLTSPLISDHGAVILPGTDSTSLGGLAATVEWMCAIGTVWYESDWKCSQFKKLEYNYSSFQLIWLKIIHRLSQFLQIFSYLGLLLTLFLPPEKKEKKKGWKKKTSALLLRNVSVVVQLQSAHKRRWEVPAEVSDSMIT